MGITSRPSVSRENNAASYFYTRKRLRIIVMSTCHSADRCHNRVGASVDLSGILRRGTRSNCRFCHRRAHLPIDASNKMAKMGTSHRQCDRHLLATAYA